MWNKLIFCLIFPGLVSLAVAQDTLNFETAIQMAVDNNLQIRNARINASAAKVQLQSKQLGRLPDINASFGNNYSWGRSVDPITNDFINEQFRSFSSGLNSSFPVFTGFKLSNSLKLAKKEFEISEGIVEKTIQDISTETALNYIRILYLEEISDAIQKQISASDVQIKMAELKFGEGYIAESEVFKVKSLKSTEEVELITVQNELRTAYLDFKQLLNLPADVQIKLLSPLSEPDNDLSEFNNVDSIVQAAVEKNPATLVSNLKIDKADINLSLSRSSLYPVVQMGSNISSGYSNTDPSLNFKRQMNANLSYGIKISVYIPLFNRFKNALDIKEKKILTEQARVDAQIERNKTSKIIYQALYDLKAALARFQSAEVAHSYAARSYEADLLKFETGRIGITELNTTKNALLRSEADLIKSKYEFIFRDSLVGFYMGSPIKF